MPDVPDPVRIPSPAEVAARVPPELHTAEHWAHAKDTPAWLFAAARIVGAWARGRELTEQDFDSTVARAGSIALK